MSLPEQECVRKDYLNWELLLTSGLGTPLNCFSQSERKATWVWGMPIILALGLRQKDHPKWKANLSYTFSSHSVLQTDTESKKQQSTRLAHGRPFSLRPWERERLGIQGAGLRDATGRQWVASMPQALMFQPPHCRKRWGTCPIFKWNLILFTGLHKTPRFACLCLLNTVFNATMTISFNSGLIILIRFSAAAIKRWPRAKAGSKAFVLVHHGERSPKAETIVQSGSFPDSQSFLIQPRSTTGWARPIKKTPHIHSHRPFW